MALQEPVEAFDGFFEVSFFALKLVGWRPKQETAPKWHKFYSWATFFDTLFSDSSGMLTFLLILGDQGKYLDIMDSALFALFGTLTIVEAFSVIFTHRNEKMAILNKFEEYLRESEWKVSKDEINQTMRKFKKIWRVLLALYVAGTSAFVINPIIEMLYGWLTKIDFKYRTPFIVWYPFEDSCGLAWIIVFLIQSWSAMSSVLIFVGSDSMFCAMTTIMCLKFSELKQEIRMAKTAQELKHCIAAHVDLIETCEMLSRIYQPIIFYNFIISTLGICLAALQLMTSEDTNMATFFGTCMLPLLQIFAVSYFADRLRESSGSIADGAFENIWRNKDREMKKQIVMIIMRAQRPQHFKAFLFGNVTLVVFTAVIKASYSYYAFLKTQIDRNPRNV